MLDPNSHRALASLCFAVALSISFSAWVNADEAVRPSTPEVVDGSEATPAAQLVKLLDAKPADGDFHGFVQHEFQIDGVACKLVCPGTTAPAAPWIWRARFWGHEPQFDIALLQKGWHVCYCDVADLFGNDMAVGRWDQFYDLSQQIGLHPKPMLEGMSRGGLIVMRWASANPNQVGGIYVDNAVMDIRSWPGGKGTGVGAAGAWKTCLNAYQMTEEQAGSFDDGPLQHLADLAKAGIPIFAMINEADDVVPPAENSDVLVQRYRALGGNVQEIRRPGLGHHPHSLKDPAPLVEFAIGTIVE